MGATLAGFVSFFCSCAAPDPPLLRTVTNTDTQSRYYCAAKANLVARRLGRRRGLGCWPLIYPDLHPLKTTCFKKFFQFGLVSALIASNGINKFLIVSELVHKLCYRIRLGS